MCFQLRTHTATTAIITSGFPPFLCLPVRIGARNRQMHLQPTYCTIINTAVGMSQSTFASVDLALLLSEEWLPHKVTLGLAQAKGTQIHCAFRLSEPFFGQVTLRPLTLLYNTTGMAEDSSATPQFVCCKLPFPPVTIGVRHHAHSLNPPVFPG